MTAHRRFKLPSAPWRGAWRAQGRRISVRLCCGFLLLPASLLTVGAISYSLWQALTFDPVAVSVSSPRHDAALSANTASATGKADAESPNWQRVAQQHWFGRPAPVTAVAPPTPAVLKETPLKLVLRGISAGRFPSAVIDAAGNTQTYEKGDELRRNNATVVDIQPDFVVLSINGRLERLSFPAEGERARLLTVTRRAAPAQIAPSSMAKVRQTLAADPQKLFSFLRFNLVNKDGQRYGWGVKPGADRTLFDAAGLQLGDIVVAINDQPVATHKKAIDLLTILPEMVVLNMTVERQDKRYELHIPLR
ncbi:MAG: type II secretion system protein N [Plesiomonas shigelloides]